MCLAVKMEARRRVVQLRYLPLSCRTLRPGEHGTPPGTLMLDFGCIPQLSESDWISAPGRTSPEVAGVRGDDSDALTKDDNIGKVC
jgi:hypothetical protein